MIQQFCQVLLYKIDKQRQEYHKRVISGVCRSLEDYRAITGKIQGLDEVDSLVRTIFKSYYPGVPININEGKHYVETDSA